MLFKPTTFVLGAGASCDFGFPTGAQLQEKIVNSLRLSADGNDFSNERIRTALNHYFFENNASDQKKQFLQAAARIIAGMPVAASIDNFLHTHQSDEFVVRLGKLAIAQVILEAEQSLISGSGGNGSDWKSKMLSTPTYQNSWYSKFIRMLTAGAQSGTPEEIFQNARFVVFNYDRCLELIIWLTFRNYLSKNDGDAFELLSSIEIVHPYGSLGSIDARNTQPLAFGADASSVNLLSISEKIQTFTESVNDNTVEDAKKCVAKSEALWFLGFGFLQANLDLLMPGDDRAISQIYATASKISPEDQMLIKNKLEKFISPANKNNIHPYNYQTAARQDLSFINIEDLNCSEMIARKQFQILQ